MRRAAPVLPDRPFRGTEAVAAGLLTRRQLRGELCRPLMRDVFVARRTTVTHEVRCAAASLVVPAGAVITGRSAAHLRGAELAGRSDPVEIVVDEAERFGPVRGLVVKRTKLAPADSVPWGRARLASSSRMAFDIARRGHLADAVADLDVVLRAGLVEADIVAAYVAERSEHGVGQVRLALGLVDPRAMSRPESIVRVALVQAGLAPHVQHAVLDRGVAVATVDLAFPAARVAVEYDGEWHALRGQLARDRQRMNRLDQAGWHVVYITSDLLGRPREIVALVRAALARHS